MPPAAFVTDDNFDHALALAACARGDRHALQRIYEQESRYLLGVALRIVRSRAAAEDVLHDAFVSIWSKAHSFDAARGVMRCGQAVVKEVPGTYTPDMKLGEA